MAEVNFEWDCKTVDYYPSYEDHSDVVFNVHWRLNAISDQKDSEGVCYSAVVYGTESLSVEDLSDFVEFADLTNEIVTGWVENVMGEEKVAELKSGLESQIDGLINPTVITGQVGS